MSRQTMGQDWGGRSAANPKGAPRVSVAQVRAYAESVGVAVRRAGPGWSMWWYLAPNDVWRQGYSTNLLMLKYLQRQFPAPSGVPGPGA